MQAAALSGASEDFKKVRMLRQKEFGTGDAPVTFYRMLEKKVRTGNSIQGCA